MKSGTLSSAAQGRFLVVWDGLIVTLPDEQAKSRFKSYQRVNARGKAIREWVTNEISRRALLDLAYRRSYQVELATFLDPTYLQKIRSRVRGDQLPVSGVQSYTEKTLDEYVRTSVDIIGVVHPFSDRAFMFGSKGIAANPGEAWQL